MDSPVQYVCLKRPPHTFIWAWRRDGEIPKVLQSLGRFAADPDLPFSWADAAAVSLEIRRYHGDPWRER